MSATRAGKDGPSEVDADATQTDERVEVERIRASTARYLARLDRLPWVTVPAAVVACVYFVAGQQTDVNLNVAVGVSFVLTAPAGLFKILWDRRQKRRLRYTISQLETQNGALRDEKAELREEVAELRGRLGLPRSQE